MTQQTSSSLVCVIALCIVIIAVVTRKWVTGITVERGNTLYTVISSDKRNEIIEQLERNLGEKLERWPGIFTLPCPPYLNRSKKKNERGLTLAHRAIWERVVKSNYAKVVIFEDDAVISSDTSIDIMRRCLHKMNTEVLFLGWCHHDSKFRMPVCCHAYALTKTACMKLLAHFDQCGPVVDEYLQNSSLTWSLCERPHDEPQHWTQGCFHQYDDGSMNA